MTNIILFGPPGSGKGTQSKKLIEKYDFFHISTGDLFRAHMANGTSLGKQIEEIVNSGGLVPDDVTISILEDTIEQNQDTTAGFIFDGFPRTLNQATSLDRLLQKKKLNIDLAIVLSVSKEELKKRITNRKKIENRTDDNYAKLIKRIDVFFNITVQAFTLYISQGKLKTIDGVGNVDKIFDEITKIIDEGKM